VPTSGQEFTLRRAEYKKALSEVREQFAGEWAARQAREAAAAGAAEASIRSKKAANDLVKAEKRAASLVRGNAERVEGALEASERTAVATAARAKVEGRLAHLRARWLRALVRDSARWIGEDMVDVAISPSSFSMKYAWHLTGWFEAKERKRALREAARRSKKPGVPLTEVVLAADDPAGAFESDWESDEEVFSPAEAAAGADAALDEAGRVGEALAVARRVFRESGMRFPEPNYDSLGEELPLDASGGGAPKGVGLLQLYKGVAPAPGGPDPALALVLGEYESWLEASIVSSLGDVAQGRVERGPSGGLELDSGERAPENAYIAACVGSGAVEALFYALSRKRARLGRDGHEMGCKAFDKAWGAWLRDVESRAGGIFARKVVVGRGGGPPPRGQEAAPVEASTVQSQATDQLQDLLVRMADMAAAARAKTEASKKAAEAKAAAAFVGPPAEDDGDEIDVRNLEGAAAIGAAAAATPLPAVPGKVGPRPGKPKVA
jgi:hypothetical protein